MKFLFRDNVVAKLKKLPDFGWMCLLYVTFFFRDAYSLVGNLSAEADSLAAQVAEMGMVVNTKAVMVVSSLIYPLIVTVIFELLIMAVYSLLARRFYIVSINRKDFAFRIRIVIILANLILGLIGIFYFFFAETRAILPAIFEYSVQTALLVWFYEQFRRSMLPKRIHAVFFMYIARIYVGIYLLIGAFQLITGLVSVPTPQGLELASLILWFLIPALSAVLGVIYYKRLVKISLETEDNDIFIRKDEDNNDIFKDLGF